MFVSTMIITHESNNKCSFSRRIINIYRLIYVKLILSIIVTHACIWIITVTDRYTLIEKSLSKT